MNVWFLLFFAVLCACNFKEDKLSTQDALPDSELSYALIADEVLGTECEHCHTPRNQHGGVLLNSYENVSASLSSIESAVFIKKSMPPSSPLTARQEQLLKRWLEIGAPETATGN